MAAGKTHAVAAKIGVMECWSNGVLGFRNDRSITPVLHHFDPLQFGAPPDDKNQSARLHHGQQEKHAGVAGDVDRAAGDAANRRRSSTDRRRRRSPSVCRAAADRRARRRAPGSSSCRWRCRACRARRKRSRRVNSPSKVISNKATSCKSESGGDRSRAADFIRQTSEQRAAEHAGGADDDEIGAEVADAEFSGVENDEIGNRRQRHIEPEQENRRQQNLRFDKMKDLAPPRRLFFEASALAPGAAPTAPSSSR